MPLNLEAHLAAQAATAQRVRESSRASGLTVSKELDIRRSAGSSASSKRVTALVGCGRASYRTGLRNGKMKTNIDPFNKAQE